MKKNKKLKVMTIVGARPQFIKAAPVSRAIRAIGHREILVHTGQHYDGTMSAVFFRELDIPAPDFNLGIGSLSQGAQTGRMTEALEKVMLQHRPDCVIVYGDTNSTLAGALAAVKLRIPVAHIEAGLRSFNREMPEEHNRVLTDHASTFLFCPTRTAVRNLKREGIRRGVYLSGDVMFDALHLFSSVAARQSRILKRLDLKRDRFLLLTVHRPSNADHAQKLHRIFSALSKTKETVIFPAHPRTLKSVKKNKLPANIRLIEPAGYLDMLQLQRNARAVVTDSGGVQKESCFLGTPCITLRKETEWVETVREGRNVLVGNDPRKIIAAVDEARRRKPQKRAKEASREIVKTLVRHLHGK